MFFNSYKYYKRIIIFVVSFFVFFSFSNFSFACNYATDCPPDQVCNSVHECVSKNDCDPVCENGQTCSEGECVAIPKVELVGCRQDCGEGKHCENGQCVSDVTPKSGEDILFNNPMGKNKTDENQILGKLVNGILGLAGSVALVVFIYGGFVYMTAMGASEKTKKGKDIILWGTIGLMVTFLAYALVKFVLVDLIGGFS